MQGLRIWILEMSGHQLYKLLDVLFSASNHFVEKNLNNEKMKSTILLDSWQLFQLTKATKTFLLVQNKARHCFNQSLETKNIVSYLLRVLLLRFVDAAQFVVVHARLGHFLSQHHRPFAHTPLLFQPRLENRPQGSLRESDANITTALGAVYFSGDRRHLRLHY